MSYQSSSSVNGRKYEKNPTSKYHKSSKKEGSHEFRHNSNSYHSGGTGSTSQGSKSSTSLGYESRIESLSLQLASAQSQVIRLETELANTNTAKSYAENRLLTVQREYNGVLKRNNEIIEVMKTLEIGVETLQQEKVALIAERDELKVKLDASENNSKMLNEQVTFLNERNTTLSKKCVDLLDGSKEFREKAALYEDELKRIKPRYEEMEANFDAINDQNRNFSTRINMFEMRERIWIKEKTEMEEKQKQNVENWQKIIADIRAKHETEINRIRQQQAVTIIGGQQQQQNIDKDKFDRHSSDLKLLLDSIKKFHSSEVENFQKKIEHLEKSSTKNKLLLTTTIPLIKQDYDESILDDEEDDDVVLIENNQNNCVSTNNKDNNVIITNIGKDGDITFIGGNNENKGEKIREE